MNRTYIAYQNRIKYIINIILIFGILILSRYFQIQILGVDGFQQKLSQKIEYRKSIKGERGRIYDRNGELLAGNIVKVDLWVNTLNDYESEKICSFAYQYFNIDSTSLATKLKLNKKKYLPIKKAIIPENLEDILAEVSSISGLNVDMYNQRFYPYEKICSHVVGYTNNKGNGRSGVELQFNDLLSESIKDDVAFDKSSNDRWKNKEKERFNDELNGNDIYLSIDIKLQKYLYEALHKGQDNSLAQSANGIIVDPFNGDILAMTGTPSYNPNNFNQYGLAKHKNNVVSKQYEPGSTIKVIPIIEAIQNLDEQMLIDCEDGEYKIPRTNRIIRDHEPHEILSLEEVLAYSSNIGIVKIADMLGEEKTYSSFRKFGLGSKTGVDLPGEEKGKISKLKKWSKTTHSTVSFGQELSVTDMQLSMIYAAIANEGYLLQPKIVKEIHYPSQIIKFDDAKIVRKVMNAETSKKVLDMLSMAVNIGSGQNAAIDGYQIAGKTGTAEKYINGEYSKTEFVSSFASIFPSSSPKYVCIISVDSPEYNKHWGNITAAPIAREIIVEMINNNFLTTNYKEIS